MAPSKKRILVTRARQQASTFSLHLKQNGFHVIECPTIKIQTPKNLKPFDSLIKKGLHYDWIFFTSVNAVNYFLWRLKKKSCSLSPVKTCAIGPVTAQAMKQAGLPVTKVAKEYVAESVLQVLPNMKDKRILIPRSKIARDILPIQLKKQGAHVTAITLYETVLDISKKENLKTLLKTQSVDCLTFTSSSTVKNFFKLVGTRLPRKALQTKKIQIASIGPITTQTLTYYGYPPQIIAKKSTLPHLTKAILKYYS